MQIVKNTTILFEPLKLLTVIAWWVYKQKKSPQSLRREDHEETPLWALRDSNPRPSACKADALNQLS